MTPNERNQKILEYLNVHKMADIVTLSELLQVSEMTVRRDLDQLEKENVLFRTHGGARLVAPGSRLIPMNDRMELRKEEKTRIAKYAASLILPGEVISMDDSSTICSMIPYLPSNLTVVTNCFSVASALIPSEETNVVFLGGTMSRTTFSTSGRDMEQMLGHYHVDRVFLSTAAMDPAKGLFDLSPEIAGTKQAFIGAGTEIYYLCDHTKLQTFSFSRVCGIEALSAVIMDACDDRREEQQQLTRACDQAGVRLILV